VITIIGSLKYLPINTLLTFAKNLLKPDGVLIVAIENQLGLKYFAGAKEDYYGIPMYGIEDRYTEDSMLTFGREELQMHLREAGLPVQQWWYPFPDYKMPTLMLGDEMTSLAQNVDLEALIASRRGVGIK